MAITESCKLIPSSIIDQSNAAIDFLINECAHIQTAKLAQTAFINDNVNRADTFKNARLLMQDYLRVASALELANDSDISDHRTLINLVGDEEFDGAEIIHDYNENVADRDHADGRVAEYQKILDRTPTFFETLQSSTAVTKIGRAAATAAASLNAGIRARALIRRNHYQSIYDTAVANIQYLVDKKGRFENIESSSKDLFTDGTELRSEAMTGLNLIYAAKSDFPDGYMYSLLTGWRTSIGHSKGEFRNRIMDRFANEDGTYNWDAISEAFSRGYDGITSAEFDALAEIYIHISLNHPFNQIELEQFINSMGIPIGRGFDIVEPFIPEVLRTTELGVFSDAPDTIWFFDSRSTNAIRDRVEITIAYLLEREWSQPQDSSERAATNAQRYTLLQASGLLYVVSTLTPGPDIFNPNSEAFFSTEDGRPGSEVIFGTEDGPGITVRMDIFNDGCLILGFTQSDLQLNTNNSFRELVNTVNDVQDRTFLTNQRDREITISTAYGPGECGQLFGRAIRERARASGLLQHEFDENQSRFNSVASAAPGFIPKIGPVYTIADALIISPIVDQVRINRVRDTINDVANAGDLASDVEWLGLSGVFITEDGVYQPPQLWYSTGRPIPNQDWPELPGGRPGG